MHTPESVQFGTAEQIRTSAAGHPEPGLRRPSGTLHPPADQPNYSRRPESPTTCFFGLDTYFSHPHEQTTGR